MSDSQREPHISERKPGRSFSDPRRPLGEDVIARADPLGGDPEQGVYGRDDPHPHYAHGVADRARCVAVLRKAEELMGSNNPSGDTEDGRRRALELAAGRCGVKLAEYYAIRDTDDEIQALEAAVMNSAENHQTKL